jgi:hypothetical protein
VNSRGTHADDPSRELSAPVSIDRRPEHVLDPRGAARQHDKAVDAERDARALRHAMGECGEEIFVDRVDDAVAGLLLLLIREEASARRLVRRAGAPERCV